MAWGGLFLSFGRPTQEQQKSCLAAAGDFNYDTALRGASRPKSAATLTAAETSDKALVERGFYVNRSRVLIGSGAATFGHAKSVLLSWRYHQPAPDEALGTGLGECGAGHAGEGGNKVLHLLQGAGPLGHAAAPDLLCGRRRRREIRRPDQRRHVCVRQRHSARPPAGWGGEVLARCSWTGTIECGTRWCPSPSPPTSWQRCATRMCS